MSRSVTLLLFIPIAASCSSSSSAKPDASGGTCDGVDVTSSVNASHTHQVCVLTSDLTAPPASGVTYTTTLVGAHTHTVTLAQADLQTIESGGTVTVTSSSDVDPTNGMDHTHTFAIMKA
ncbi:MAG TPA: hypothetical protein VLX92_33600 [Kofleriaceae bacterium]|nr:hypothetical protein [Kofleriaceae bacterium]